MQEEKQLLLDLEKNANDKGGAAAEVAKAIDKAHEASNVASTLQLVVCGSETDASFTVCENFDDQPFPAALELLSKTSKSALVANFSGWKDVATGYILRRYAPVI